MGTVSIMRIFCSACRPAVSPAAFAISFSNRCTFACASSSVSCVSAPLIRVQGIATLEQAIAMATRIGGLREMQAGSAFAPSAAAASSSAASGSAPMDLDALNALGLDAVEGLESETAAANASSEVAALRDEMRQMLNAMREHLDQQ